MSATPPPTSPRPHDLRLFIALYPPLEVARLMLGLLTGATTGSTRPTPVRQVHMTLRFLGNVPSEEVGPLSSAIAIAAASTPPFELRPIELFTLPPRRPRLIALRTDSPPPLQSLAHQLAAITFTGAETAREHETFLPHITLLRAGRNESIRPVHRPITTTTIPPFPITRISLMRSVLDQSGAVHEQVRGFELNA